MKAPEQVRLLRRIRILTCLFILGLVVSGLTAIPLETEIDALLSYLGLDYKSSVEQIGPLSGWLLRLNTALSNTADRYPFLFYATDWLAFGHIVIAIAFLGALHDPIRNRWLFDFGLIACGLVIPWAILFGSLRGIPVGWQLIDCLFGVLAAVPLWLCRRWVRRLESLRVHRSTRPAAR